MARTAPGFALLLVVLLAGCSVNQPTPTPIVNVQLGDLPSYPNVVGAITSVDSKAFPQATQYNYVQAITFTSPDESGTIRQWYKQQLTSKGWQVVADAPNLLGIVPANRDKLIELFFTPSGAGSTRVIAYYASGRKPTPIPLKSAGWGLTNRSLMRIIKRTQQRSSAVERWPSG